MGGARLVLLFMEGIQDREGTGKVRRKEGMNAVLCHKGIEMPNPAFRIHFVIVHAHPSFEVLTYYGEVTGYGVGAHHDNYR
jgi:hypothetical protein